MSGALLIDSNLLVLYAVGLTSPTNISRHKRLTAYDRKAYELLRGVLSAHSTLLLCPNVLTEASNLARQTGEPLRSLATSALAEIIGNANEEYMSSSEAALTPEFAKLGLTDAVLLLLARKPATLLTADLDLYLAALRAGREAANFNHLRS